MRVTLTCKNCQHRWEISDEPLALTALSCPRCDTAAQPRAVEDLASSLEDALCQLGLLGKTLDLHIELSTAALPEPFRVS